MLESELQAQVLKEIDRRGIYAFKVVSCNRRGVPDIIGLHKGKFFAIELKANKWKKVSNLQMWNITQIARNKGNTLVTYDLEKVKQFLDFIEEE